MRRRFLAAAMTAAALTSGALVADVSPAQAASHAELIGNFHGDGRDEIFYYAAGPDADYMERYSNGGVSGGEITTASQAWPVNGTYDPLVGDFDGDGYDEILWYGPGSAPDNLWNFTSPTTMTTRSYTVNGVYRGVVGDFLGDGVDDIIWYAPGSGQDWIWDYNAGGSYNSKALAINGYYTPVAGSFGSNATDDVLWYAAGTTADFLWDFRVGLATYTTRSYAVNGHYRPIVLDAWNDGWRGDDIFWYAPGTAGDTLWDFYGGSVLTAFPEVVDDDYLSAIAGDIFGDGYDDLIWLWGPADTQIWDHVLNPENGGLDRWIYTFPIDATVSAEAVPSAVGSEDVTVTSTSLDR